MSMAALYFVLLGPPGQPGREVRVQELIEEIARSGRIIAAGAPGERLMDPRRQIAPGRPPLLRFRYLLGAGRHRFGQLDLMLDDAGH